MDGPGFPRGLDVSLEPCGLDEWVGSCAIGDASAPVADNANQDAAPRVLESVGVNTERAARMIRDVSSIDLCPPEWRCHETRTGSGGFTGRLAEILGDKWKSGGPE